MQRADRGDVRSALFSCLAAEAMRSERLQAVLVFGLDGVRLLNKEQVVHHDDKGAKVDGVAAKRGKREHRLGKRGDCSNDTELKRAVNLRRLVGTLDARNARGKIDEALGDNHGRGEHGVRSVGGLELAGRDAGDSNDETGDAQNKINQGKDFESLASEAHGWSFRYEYANLAHPMCCTYGEAHCSSTRRCMRLKASLACTVQPFKKESWT